MLVPRLKMNVFGRPYTSVQLPSSTRIQSWVAISVRFNIATLICCTTNIIKCVFAEIFTHGLCCADPATNWEPLCPLYFQIHAPGHETVTDSALPPVGWHGRRGCGPGHGSSVGGSAADWREGAGVCRDHVLEAGTRHCGIISLQ